MFSVLIDVLKQVNPSLVFTAPLLLPCVPLLIVLDLSQLIDHLFVGCLVILSSLIVSLQLLDLTAALHAFLLFDLLDGSLSLKCRLQEHLISLQLLLVGLLSKLLFCGIVSD